MSGAGVRASLGETCTHNSIVRVRSVDPSFRQTVRAVNSGMAWSTDGSISVSLPITQSMEWRIANYLYLDTGAEYINDQKNASRKLRNRMRFRADYYFSDILSVHANVQGTFNRIRYSLNDELNQSYTNSTVDVEVSWEPADNWSFDSSLLYRIFDRAAFDAGKNVALLNLSVSHLLLRRRGSLRLELNDVFNQNQGITLTTTPNYLEEERIVSFGRYVMLKFTYKPRLM